MKLPHDEEEITSLVDECQDMGVSSTPKVRSSTSSTTIKKKDDVTTNNNTGGILKRNYIVPTLITIVTVGFILLLSDGKLEDLNEENDVAKIPDNHLVENYSGGGKAESNISNKYEGFHTMSFGGVNNIAHPGGAKAAMAGEGIAFSDIPIPISAVDHAIPSLRRANLVNLFGHYVHDEHRSPYASYLYDKPKKFLDDEQEKFVKKMEQVRKEWAAWNFTDDKQNRPIADFSSTEYKDLANDKFPDGSWQTDESYVNRFIAEARNLVDTMIEAIYAEYGSPLKKTDGSYLTEDEKKTRDEAWKLLIFDKYPGGKFPHGKGIGNMYRVAFDGLVRKLLHTLITNDEFYAIVGGHSAAAGHGNNFQQQYMMSFHRIMEPVFDKLGSRLISRNMAMGGVGTLHFSLAGGDIYGEADIMYWDSSMTEKGNPVDLFNKQAIFSGERVPLILSSFHHNIMEETNNTAWMGEIVPDLDMVPKTIDLTQAKQLPYAARWINGENEKYNAICWEPRKDVNPKTAQSSKVGGQASWHPGFRSHQFTGRKLALIVLHGLAAALDKWEEGIQKDGFPLSESYWHIGDSYKTIRRHLAEYMNTPRDEEKQSDCEKLYPWISRICRFPMHGFGMWHPRATDFDFLDLIHPAPNGYKPEYTMRNEYSGFDLLPHIQAVPDGEIDVHAIAIATTNPPPEFNHNWSEDDEVISLDSIFKGTVNGTRWLTEVFLSQRRKGVRSEPHVGYGVDKRWKTQNYRSPMSFDVDNANGTTRRMADAIVPGKGWEVLWKSHHGITFDGSAQSEGHREGNCLEYGSNDQHEDVSGNSLSGWLVFTVPKVKEGVILVRMEWWCDKKSILTAGWTEVNDGKTNDTLNGRRLKPTKDQFVPSDFEMDYAINGKVKTMKRDEWLEHTIEYSKNCAVWPLLDDEEMSKKWKEGEEGENVEVAIRFRSKIMPQQSYCISHVYYA